MKLIKIVGTVAIGAVLMTAQSIQVGTQSGSGWVSFSFNYAAADGEDRRVARRTSRRTASRQACGSSWC
ncbi:MAG: hypothetical protein ACO3RT_07195 [Arenicellales bacterium]|jgi:hypothetical protein|nr:hypothetical protein [Gammaproteobacteria bacterium]